ncbi:MAG: hypothetical protein ACFE8A_08570 [Candidatus Hodarchaeota archaeon]
MNIKNWREFAFIFLMIGCVQYIILTTIAMFFYAGGTIINPNASGYSFWHNFFSDLGRTRAHSGKSNTISYVIFTITFCILATSLISFLLAFPKFFKETTKEKALSLIGSIIGIFTGILLIAVALTPWDLYSYEHLMLVLISGISGLFAIIAYLIAEFLNKQIPNKYAYILLVYAIVFGVYVILLFAGIDISTSEGLMIQATMQKIMFYIFLICEITQGYIGMKLE